MFYHEKLLEELDIQQDGSTRAILHNVKKTFIIYRLSGRFARSLLKSYAG